MLHYRKNLKNRIWCHPKDYNKLVQYQLIHFTNLHLTTIAYFINSYLTKHAAKLQLFRNICKNFNKKNHIFRHYFAP